MAVDFCADTPDAEAASRHSKTTQVKDRGRFNIILRDWNAPEMIPRKWEAGNYKSVFSIVSFSRNDS